MIGTLAKRSFRTNADILVSSSYCTCISLMEVAGATETSELTVKFLWLM